MVSIEHIVESLGGQWNGYNTNVLCPAHQDEKPSLSISEGEDDRVLWYCHAGCSQMDVLAAMRAQGLDPLSNGSAKPKAHRSEDNEPGVDAYTRLRETLAVMRTSKRGPKAQANIKKYLKARGITIQPPPSLKWSEQRRRPILGRYRNLMQDENGIVVPVINSADGRFAGIHAIWLDATGTKCTWKQSLGRIKGGVVRFGGPVSPSDVLLIVEGPETGLSVHELTSECVWCSLGASNLPNIAVPPCRELIICADNDEAGRKAAEALAERVARSGTVVRIAVPPTEDADWNDMLSAGDADGKKLRRMILDAAIVKPPSGLRAITARELAQYEFPQRRYLLKPWMPQQGLAMIHAPRGVGKTYFALGVAFAIAREQPFLRWGAENVGDVLYVDGELPGVLMQERVRGFERYFGQAGEFDVRIVTPDLQDGGMPDLSTPDGQAKIDRLVTEKTVLIVVDSISTLCRSGEENAAESWLPIQNWALSHRAAGRSVLFLHHSGKEGRQRGTSRREDVLDTVINLKRPKGYTAEEGATFEVHFEKARSFFGLDAAPLDVHLGFDDEGNMEWTEKIGGDSRMHRIVKMQNDGKTQKEIAEAEGVSEARISQLFRTARENGLLSEDMRQAAMGT